MKSGASSGENLRTKSRRDGGLLHIDCFRKGHLSASTGLPSLQILSRHLNSRPVSPGIDCRLRRRHYRRQRLYDLPAFGCQPPDKIRGWLVSIPVGTPMRTIPDNEDSSLPVVHPFSRTVCHTIHEHQSIARLVADFRRTFHPVQPSPAFPGLECRVSEIRLVTRRNHHRCAVTRPNIR